MPSFRPLTKSLLASRCNQRFFHLVGQTSLITDSSRKALLADVEELTADIETHVQGGMDQHDTQVILDQPYVSLSGETIANKTLKLGTKLDGVPIFIFIPAFDL